MVSFFKNTIREPKNWKRSIQEEKEKKNEVIYHINVNKQFYA